MAQVQNVVLNATDSIQQHSEAQSSVSYDEIVGNLVNQGLPQAFNPNNYLSKIADTYSISLKEARTCLKLAINELENKRAQKAPQEKRTTVYETKTETKEETPFAQTGYYYPSAKVAIIGNKNDGMDNLNSFGCYNKLMFGIK